MTFHCLEENKLEYLMAHIWQRDEQAGGEAVCSGTSGRSGDRVNENGEEVLSWSTCPFLAHCPVPGEEVPRGGIDPR